MSQSAAFELILASASPRRRELLAVFGLPFVVVPSAIDETPTKGESPRHYVERIAREKAVAVAREHPKACVLGSDTAVVLDDEPLGKPTDAAQARAMLQRLSARNHRVLTAVALLQPDGGLGQRLSETEVEFDALTAAWIDRYLASGDPFDKAGAYGIQNAAGTRVRRISGSYTGVVGLPLYETGDLLRSAGLIL